MAKNYYDTLGVSKTADSAEIKKAYRKKATEHHPDKGGDEEKFKEVNEAYSVLSDDNKRHSYDNPMPDFGRMGGSFADMMGGFGGFRSRPSQSDLRNAPSRGGDIKFSVDVPLHNFIFGTKIDVGMSYDEACPSCESKGYSESEICNKCGGRGQFTEVRGGGNTFIQTSRTCSECNGSGRITITECERCNGSGKVKIEDKKFSIEVKKGMRDGNVLKKVGEGRRGINGGPNGDLYVKLKMLLPNPDSLTNKQRKILESL